MTIPYKSTLWIIIASASLMVMGGSIIVPVLNLMEEGLGVDSGAARLIITTHGIFIAIFSPLVGILIDKFGVRRPFIAGLLLYGLAGSSGVLINDYLLLLVSRMLVGISIAAIYASITVMILDLYKGATRDKVTGWRSSGSSGGGIVWPLLGGFLGTFSWHWSFATYFLAFVLGILAIFMVPESHKNTTAQSDTLSSEGSVLRIFKSKPILFAIYAIIFLGNVFLYAIMIFLPKIFVELGLSSPFYIGLTITTMGIASAATSLLYSRVKAKLSYRAIAVLITFLWAVALFMMSQAFSVWFVWLSIVICGIGMGIMMPAIPIWAGEQVSPSYRGRITSYLGTFGFVGQFLSPIFLSPVATSLGLSWVFIVSGGISVLVMIAFSLSLRR